MKLNLGSGNKPLVGFVNVDRVTSLPVDEIVRLEKTPWPWLDNSVEFVEMSHILEHLPNTIAVMEELFRVLKPGGRVHIRVPYYKSRNAFSDPTHVRFFTEESMEYFCEGGKYSYYSNVRFRVIKFSKNRDTSKFPKWHLKKYLGISIGHVWELEWVLEKP